MRVEFQEGAAEAVAGKRGKAMRTIAELQKAIIANYTTVVDELGDEACAAGLDETDDLMPSDQLTDIAIQRCALTSAEMEVLVRWCIADNLGVAGDAADAVYGLVAAEDLQRSANASAKLLICFHEVDRGNQLRRDCLAALLDEEVPSRPAKLFGLVRAALYR